MTVKRLVAAPDKSCLYSLVPGELYLINPNCAWVVFWQRLDNGNFRDLTVKTPTHMMFLEVFEEDSTKVDYFRFLCGDKIVETVDSELLYCSFRKSEGS